MITADNRLDFVAKVADLRAKLTKGRIHIVTPDGRVELTADFENKADFERIKAFVNKEDSILFCDCDDIRV